MQPTASGPSPRERAGEGRRASGPGRQRGGPSPGTPGPQTERAERLGRVIFLPVSVTWKANSIPLSLFVSYHILHPSSFHTCSLEDVLRSLCHQAALGLSPAGRGAAAAGWPQASLRVLSGEVLPGECQRLRAQKGHLQAFCCLRGTRCLVWARRAGRG